MAHPYWPLFDLRVRTPRLELRLPTDEDLVALAAEAARGVHEPGFMPFLQGWTAAPSPELERNVFQWSWRQRAEWTPEKWALPLGVVVDGEVIGIQGLDAANFAITRAVSSGSWIGLRHQGRGIGKEMRSAMLHLAFEGLGANVAYSGAFDDNPRSIGVSRALGYVENGDTIERRGDAPARQVRFKLDRATWEARRRDDVVIEGLERSLVLFGVAPPG